MTANSPVKIIIILFKEWMTTILTVAKIDTIHQAMYGCNESGKVSNWPLKKLNAQDKSSKKNLFLISSCRQKLSVPYNQLKECSCKVDVPQNCIP